MRHVRVPAVTMKLTQDVEGTGQPPFKFWGQGFLSDICKFNHQFTYTVLSWVSSAITYWHSIYKTLIKKNFLNNIVRCGISGELGTHPEMSTFNGISRRYWAFHSISDIYVSHDSWNIRKLILSIAHSLLGNRQTVSPICEMRVKVNQ